MRSTPWSVHRPDISPRSRPRERSRGRVVPDGGCHGRVRHHPLARRQLSCGPPCRAPRTTPTTPQRSIAPRLSTIPTTSSCSNRRSSSRRAAPTGRAPSSSRASLRAVQKQHRMAAARAGPQRLQDRRLQEGRGAFQARGLRPHRRADERARNCLGRVRRGRRQRRAGSARHAEAGRMGAVLPPLPPRTDR